MMVYVGGPLQMLLGINLERVYCTVNVNTFFIYTVQMSDL